MFFVFLDDDLVRSRQCRSKQKHYYFFFLFFEILRTTKVKTLADTYLPETFRFVC